MRETFKQKSPTAVTVRDGTRKSASQIIYPKEIPMLEQYAVSLALIVIVPFVVAIKKVYFS